MYLVLVRCVMDDVPIHLASNYANAKSVADLLRSDLARGDTALLDTAIKKLGWDKSDVIAVAIVEMDESGSPVSECYIREAQVVAHAE